MAVHFVVTGFGEFHGVKRNPTQVLVEWLDQKQRARGSTITPQATATHASSTDAEAASAAEEQQEAYRILSCTVLEVSATAVCKFLEEQAALLQAACSAAGKQPVVLLHLGVDNQRICLNLELQAFNNATFRCPDEAGWQPSGLVIEQGQGLGLSSVRSTALPVQQLAQELHGAGFDCHVSRDAGRFVCNYIYHKSLQLTHTLSRSQQDAAAANEQQAATACLEGELVQLPATHRRGILQGMLGTAAMTITSPTADAAAAQPPAATADPAQQQSSSTGSSSSSSSESLSNAKACNGSARGAAAARDPTINSGCATPASVRQQQQMSGLVPPRQVGLDVEVMRAQAALDGCSTDLEKHRLLVTLKETNAAAFAALLQGDLEGLLPLVYTPTIGAACLAWGSLLPRPTGLYITSADRGKVDQVLQHWPSDEVRIAVVTDGERILGLGDLGAHGMGIPTGKCVVYSAAGAAPSWLLPITVDVGTNNAALLSDPLYIGQPQQRLRGQPYQALMLEVVQGLQRRFGRQVLLHWEDLAVRNAFSVLQLAQGAGVPTFNDDIQATAAVAVAAVLGGVRVPGVLPLAQQRWLFFGAGQANLGTARLLAQALQQQGVTAAAAKARIWMQWLRQQQLLVGHQRGP
ncbi:hypothetical protein OEZ85_006994 [Tetradesmus obliquus]|uniref:Pyroglutamyl-peptidase I n=1 Tax=Tetradesmus obliquus TaxID=3088 RepID=A0ABY8TX25_TETOB|nr:hypothetical protein OEZ85_006994 [Tetradesmus obliquus]